MRDNGRSDSFEIRPFDQRGTVCPQTQEVYQNSSQNNRSVVPSLIKGPNTVLINADIHQRSVANVRGTTRPEPEGSAIVTQMAQYNNLTPLTSQSDSDLGHSYETEIKTPFDDSDCMPDIQLRLTCSAGDHELGSRSRTCNVCADYSNQLYRPDETRIESKRRVSRFSDRNSWPCREQSRNSRDNFSRTSSDTFAICPSRQNPRMTRKLSKSPDNSIVNEGICYNNDLDVDDDHAPDREPSPPPQPRMNILDSETNNDSSTPCPTVARPSQQLSISRRRHRVKVFVTYSWNEGTDDQSFLMEVAELCKELEDAGVLVRVDTDSASLRARGHNKMDWLDKQFNTVSMARSQMCLPHMSSNLNVQN